MMKISREEVLHIAALVRLGLDENEIDNFRNQLSDILDNFEILKQLDTSNLAPTAQSISVSNVFRTDEAADSYPVDKIMENAPGRDGDYFKVQSVLE
jgi:aspartyl-tRNA(Asn)/glutamyl-tRNA(Gln) amidotransferase subunit C